MGKNTNLKMSLIISAFLFWMGSAVAAGGTIYVDADASVGGDGSGWGAAFKYLQDALTAAVSGDVILVAHGIYKPDQYSAQPNGTGLRTDTFRLKNGVVIRGGYAGFGEPDPDARDINAYETVMSGDIGVVNYLGDNSYNVVISNGINQTAVLDGFIITAGNANGPAPYNNGSGMVNDHSSPTLTNCTIIGNFSEDSGAMNNHDGSNPKLTNCMFIGNTTERGGGAMKNYMSRPTLINCTFSNNSAGWGGGAINNVSESSPTLTNCMFIGNSAGWCGGGIDNMSSNPTLTNCTFSGNSAGWAGGGMNNGAGSSPSLTNCIIWGNTPQEITTDGGGAAVISYSDIRGGWPGTGNINANPLFVDPAIGDYHLLPDSPCIDAGYNPAVPPSVVTDLDGNPRITAGIVDMGAYELQRPSTLYVDDNASGKNNGSSWDDAFNDLQNALAVAYPGSEIRVAQGIYTPEGPLHSQASNPNPPNGAGPVSITADLSWTAGAYATSHDVYFGTSSPGMFQGNQSGTTFDPGTMAMGTKYYWRIDEVSPSGTTTGTIWSFMTIMAPPPMASNVSHDTAITVPDRTVAFQLKNGVTIKGGYAGFGQPDPNARDIVKYKTILSGDLAGNDVDIQDPLDMLEDLQRAENSYHVVSGSDCNESAVLDGFTITAGNANGPPDVPNSKGGGMYNDTGSPTLSNCMFVENAAGCEGGGIYNLHSNPILTNCTFQRNSAAAWSIGRGGGMYNHQSSPTLTNCTFTDNPATSEGGGMYNGGQSSPTVTNCILWGNTAPTGPQIHNDETSWTIVTCSDVQGGHPGQGNIDVEPCFVDPGYWDANGVWIDGNYHLLQTSACINAGDNNSLPADTQDLDGDSNTTEPIPFDLDGNPRIVYEVVDMGAFEFDNTPAIANAGDDQTIECACNTEEGTKVTLDGSNSSDPDGGLLTYTWTGPFVESPVHGVAPTVTLEEGCPGDYVITLVVDDGIEESEPNDVLINVVDTTPPAFVLSVAPAILWPPNHEMVLITPSWTVSDDCVPSPDVSLVSIAMNEGDNTVGDGHTTDDIQIGKDGSIYVRSERSGAGNDRIYTITYQAFDDCGNTTVSSAIVSIPHDFKVLARITARWLWSGREGSIPADLNGDGVVNLADFARFAGNWTK